jgi:TolB-like protein/Tfp pilus assembly protein PilF
MTDTPSEREGDSAWARLRRRKVVQWGLAYAAGAWALLQGVGFVADAFAWPAVAKQLATIALLIGLPIALTLAWYHGDKGEQRVTRPELLVLAFLLLGGGALLWHFERASNTATVPTAAVKLGTSTVLPASDPSIAVLPFVDMSAAKDQEYFADGMSEEVLSLLTQLPQLKVIARTSSFSFKGKEVDVATIAQQLNVAHVLEGSVRRSGDTVRITAQLIRTSDSTHLWSQTYDRKLTDVLQVQDEIAGAVVAALKVKLLSDQHVTNRYRGSNTEAYNQYLLGQHLSNRGSVDDMDGAVAAYRQAISLDPAFAAAYAGLATAEYFASEYAATEEEVTTGKKRALEAADEAIRLAPDLADGYEARSFILGAWIWNWDGARADIDRALLLAPGNVQALLQYAGLLALFGKIPESLVASKKATELDPLSVWAWHSLGGALMEAGQMEQARAALSHALTIQPDSTNSYMTLGDLELLQGRPQVALELFHRSDTVWRLIGEAKAEHSLGHEEQSRRALDELTARWAHTAAYQIAQVHAWRGDKDAAFEWLERAYVQRDGSLPTIRTDDFLTSLRTDPRFAAIVKKLGLPP